MAAANDMAKRMLKPLKSGRRVLRGALRLARYAKFLAEFRRFKKLHSSVRKDMLIEANDLFPCLDEKTETTNFDAHYVYHTAWAARKVRARSPHEHVDVSSSLYFAGIVSAFVPLKFLDYRPAGLGLSGLEEERGDLAHLPLPDASVASLSCMHVVEHVGLGRYGDPLDPLGDIKAASELQRVLAVSGRLLFVVPVGVSRIFFNAHRVYHPGQVVAMFPELNLESFSLVTDSGEFVDDAPLEMGASQHYGCGCFEFLKAPRSSRQAGGE